MSAFILRPIPILATALNAGAHPTVSNLANPQPKAVFTAAFGAINWALRIDVDLGQDEVVDTAGLLFHTGAVSPSNTWRMWARSAAEGPFGAAPAVLEMPEQIVFNAIP